VNIFRDYLHLIKSLVHRPLPMIRAIGSGQLQIFWASVWTVVPNKALSLSLSLSLSL